MQPHTLQEAIGILHVSRAELALVYGVSNLGLFGSFVRGDATADSDIDILVEYSEPPTLFEFVRLQRHLSELLDMQVDLVMKSALKPKIGERVLVEVVRV